MGQLFDRVSRVVRANRNSNEGDCKKIYLNEGTTLTAGGAVTGASIGKVGILAGGTGYSLGAVPLAAVGALTGAALYEALRSLLENDASSANAAAIGAAAGAATSAAIGGVGVAISGSAIGVGMASMAAGGAVVGLGLVGLNRLLQQGIDPEKLLDSAIEQMEADSKKARQAIAHVMASQRQLQQQYEKAQLEVNKWQQRAQLALKKGDEYLAGEALSRKKMHSGILSSLEAQLDQEPASVKNLKRNLTLLEAKISEAKAMRTNLKAQIAAAMANGRLHTSGAMGAFERMEEKVLQLEARSQAAAELAGTDLESQFAALELGIDVDDELAAMKA
ncbi:PspA/IM30 family protein [Leptolyngbya sp. FACHB-671]|uniref:PspA/IM30 family protein n=1 Tax=Leptolyngbya sp. FACHB-671 TaxID=2692812 RepID=UPI001F5581E9|nr:PspA/IM30 family protein [Leptolyngbya sp. FACHB-671]